MPTGIATTVLGAAVLVALARRRGDGPTGAPARTALSVPSRRRFAVVLVTGAIAVTGCLLLGLLGGHTWIRTGDVVLWVQGEGAPVARFALDERAPAWWPPCWPAAPWPSPTPSCRPPAATRWPNRA